MTFKSIFLVKLSILSVFITLSDFSPSFADEVENHISAGVGNVYNYCNAKGCQVRIFHMSKQQYAEVITMIMQYLLKYQNTSTTSETVHRSNSAHVTVRYDQEYAESPHPYNPTPVKPQPPEPYQPQVMYQTPAPYPSPMTAQSQMMYQTPAPYQSSMPYQTPANYQGVMGCQTSEGCNSSMLSNYIVRPGTSLMYNLNNISNLFGWHLIVKTSEDITFNGTEVIPMVSISDAINKLIKKFPIKVSLYKKNKVIVASLLENNKAE